MFERYTLQSRIYSFTSKGRDFIYDVAYFGSLADAQSFGRKYVREFNLWHGDFHRLHSVTIICGNKEFGLYGRH